MAFGSNNASLLFRLKTEADTSELKKFKTELDGITKSAGGGATGIERLAQSSGFSAAQFSSMANFASIAAVGGDRYCRRRCHGGCRVIQIGRGSK